MTDYNKIKINSFKQLQELKQNMNELFDKLLYLNQNTLTEVMPAYDIIEDNDKFIILMDIAGININDLQIEAKPLVIKIYGKRHIPLDLYKDKNILTQEIFYGEFKRNIALPEKIQVHNVEAKYKNGILYLTLPKAKSKSIKIDIE